MQRYWSYFRSFDDIFQEFWLCYGYPAFIDLYYAQCFESSQGSGEGFTYGAEISRQMGLGNGKFKT